LGRNARCSQCNTRFVVRSGKGEQIAPKRSSDGAKVASASKPPEDTKPSPGNIEDGVPAEWNVRDVILDLYEVIGILGQGGMGKVYKVHHRGWDMDLAVKSPRSEQLTNAKAVENFERECETWVNLGLHPHIVSCFYVRRLGNIPRVFAECISGGDLQTWIREGRLYEGGNAETLRRILDVAIQFAWGLHYAHEQGLVHQDVKPANVMMLPDGTAKVTDFGLAKSRSVSELATPGEHGQSILVSNGGMTPAYCSPEQAKGEALSSKTDIWSWGVSVLQMFTGDVVWRSGTLAFDALQEYLEEGNNESIPVMPEALVELLEQCFQRDPERRPTDLNELAFQLKEIYEQQCEVSYFRSRPKASELLAGGLNNQGASLLDLKKFDTAGRLFVRALEIDSQHPEANYNYGLSQWRSGSMTDDNLIARLQSVCDSDRDDWVPWYLLAQVHLERQDCRGAQSALEQIQNGKEHSQVQKARRDSLEQESRSLKEVNAIKGLSAEIASVVLTSTGQHLLSADFEGTIRLWDVEKGNCIREFRGHSKLVHSVGVSADERIVVSGSADRTVRVWDVTTGRCIHIFEGHDDIVSSVSISSDGNRVLSGSHDESMRLWNISAGACDRIFNNKVVDSDLKDVPSGKAMGFSGEITSVCLSVDSSLAISGSFDGKVRIWNTSTGECLHTLSAHKGRAEMSKYGVQCVSLSADARLVLSGGCDGTVKLWDVGKGKCLRTFKGNGEDVDAVNLSSDGRFALSASVVHQNSAAVRLWDTSTGQCLRTFDGHTDVVTSLSFSSDSEHAVSGSCDKSIRIWRVNSQTKSHVAQPFLSRIVTGEHVDTTNAEFLRQLALGRRQVEDGKLREAADTIEKGRELTGCKRRREGIDAWSDLYLRLRRTNLRDAWECASWRVHDAPVFSVSLSQDARFAYSGSADKTVRVIDIKKSKPIMTLEPHPNTVVAVAPSQCGNYALTGSYKTVKWWDLRDGSCLRDFSVGGEELVSLSLSSDSRLALSATCHWGFGGIPHGAMHLWDVESGRCIREFTKEGGLGFANLSPDGRYVLSGRDAFDHPFSGPSGGEIQMWEVATGRRVFTGAGYNANITSLAFTCDGTRAVIAGTNGLIIVFDLATGQMLHTLQGHTDIVNSVAVSTDCRFAVSCSNDRTVKVWSLDSGMCLHTLSGHEGNIHSVALSQDCRYVISGGDDHTVRLWFLDWALQGIQEEDWHEDARVYLETFLTLHTPYESDMPSNRDPTEEEVTRILRRSGKPKFSDKDFERLLHTLRCSGFGWLRPEGVRKRLEEMAADWQSEPVAVTPKQQASAPDSQIVSNNPIDPQKLFLRATQHEQRGEYQEAADAYEVLLDWAKGPVGGDEPQNVRPIAINLAQILNKLGEYDRSLELAEYGLALNPSPCRTLIRKIKQRAQVFNCNRTNDLQNRFRIRVGFGIEPNSS